MRLVLMGPPGAGKGTQAAYITTCFSIPHISTGDMLRDMARQHTPLGEEVAGLINTGQLVPDHLMVDLVKQRLLREQGFILDGFPRSTPQAESLEAYLDQNGKPLDAVLVLSLADDEIVRRLTHRRSCPSCGRSYHLLNNPPQLAGQCDSDGASLEQREDDREEFIRTRLEAYHRQTEPVLEFYRKRGLLQAIDAAQEIREVQNQIAQLLEGCAA